MLHLEYFHTVNQAARLGAMLGVGDDTSAEFMVPT